MYHATIDEYDKQVDDDHSGSGNDSSDDDKQVED